MDDAELLQDFAERGSEAAFRAVVDRHVNLVYSTARQTIQNPQLVEEVVQTVFTIVARKARRLGRVQALSAWLYRTTRLAAIQAVRNEARRRQREEQYAAMDHTPSDNLWEQVEPHLGEVMDQLSETDRAALVLRFFESKSLKDVARGLGTSEDAARMRVNRAIEKARALFVKRGVTATASALVAAITANAMQAAPAGLAASAAAAALAPISFVTPSALVKGTLKLMAWNKVKAIAMAALALLIMGGTTGLVLHQQFSSRARPVKSMSAEQRAVLRAADTLVHALAQGDEQTFAAGLYAPDDAERRLVATYGALAKGIGSVSQALLTRFGDTEAVWRIRYSFSLMSGIPMVGYMNQPIDIDVIGDEALFRCPTMWPGHTQSPLRFMRVADQWKLAIDIGPRRGRWLEKAVAQHEAAARGHEDFAKEILAGRYPSPQAAWEAWSGQSELPRPAKSITGKWYN